MDVADGVEPVDRRGAKRAEEFRAGQVVMQRQAAHQRAVDEQIERHGVPAHGFCETIISYCLV
jgi:hypothetical protein